MARCHKELNDAQRSLIVDLFDAQDVSADWLPYTPEFEDMHVAFVGMSGFLITPAEFFRAIVALRKQGEERGGLRKKGRTKKTDAN